MGDNELSVCVKAGGIIIYLFIYLFSISMVGSSLSLCIFFVFYMSFFLFFRHTHATAAHLQSPRPDKNWLSGKNRNHRYLRTDPQHPTGDSKTTGHPMDCYQVQQVLEAAQGEEAETRMPGRTTKSA